MEPARTLECKSTILSPTSRLPAAAEAPRNHAGAPREGPSPPASPTPAPYHPRGVHPGPALPKPRQPLAGEDRTLPTHLKTSLRALNSWEPDSSTCSLFSKCPNLGGAGRPHTPHNLTVPFPTLPHTPQPPPILHSTPHIPRNLPPFPAPRPLGTETPQTPRSPCTPPWGRNPKFRFTPTPSDQHPPPLQRGRPPHPRTPTAADRPHTLPSHPQSPTSATQSAPPAPLAPRPSTAPSP